MNRREKPTIRFLQNLRQRGFADYRSTQTRSAKNDHKIQVFTEGGFVKDARKKYSDAKAED